MFSGATSSPQGPRSNKEGLITLREKTRLQPRASWEWGVWPVWVGVCLFSCLDTRLFVYLSLSQTLVSGLFILLLGSVAVWHSWRRGHPLMSSKVQCLVLLWGLYLLIHSLFCPQTEYYKLAYMEVTLTLLFTLPYLLREGLLSRKHIERGWLLMLVVQLGTLLLQARGTVSSYNRFFSLTGCSENPNVTAILLVMMLPLLYDKVVDRKEKRVPYGVLLVLTLLFVILLKCRTAYLGLLVMIVVKILSHRQIRQWWKGRTLWYKTGLTLGLVTFAVALGVGLYQMKRDSANGRLLVWKVSAQMMKQHPEGIGVGMFEHDYNLSQANYWQSGLATEAERWVSDTVFMAYNDYLETGVETGILGTLFLLTFFVSVIVTAYRRRDTNTLKLTVASAVMAGVNFFYATIQPWLILLSAVSLMLGQKNETENRLTRGVQPISKILITIGIAALLCWQSTLLWSQYQLGKLSRQAEKGEQIDLPQAESISQTISTSEAYWTFMYRQYAQREDYHNALRCIEEAQKYTSEPSLFFSAFDCYDGSRRTAEGIPSIVQVSRMLPQNLTSRVILLNWYDKKGDVEKAIGIAKEIVNIPTKIDNKQSSEIRAYAKKYLFNNQNYK